MEKGLEFGEFKVCASVRIKGLMAESEIWV